MKGNATQMVERLKEKRNEEGFTLIELLIVIVILAILAAIVVFAVGTTTTNAKQSACNADGKSVETAVEAFKAQTGGYPTPAGVNGMDPLLAPSGPNQGPWLRQAPSATVANNGYVIALAASGVVNVTTAAGTINIDTQTATTGCNGIP